MSDHQPWVYIPLAEGKIGRRLRANEVVHHVDFDHANNDPTNLRVMTRSAHGRLHMRAR